MITQEQQAWEQLAQQVMAEVRRVWEAGGQAENAEQLEQAVLEWRARTGKLVLQSLSQEAVRRCEQEQTPMCCSRRMDYHSRQDRTVLTLLGSATVRRRYYRCLRCGRSLFPADGWWGGRGAFSHHLQEAVAWQCSLLPYREARESLRKLAGVEVSVLGAERIVARWGKAEVAPAPYAAVVENDLVVQIDGTTAHLQEGWKEIKLGACFDWDCADPAAKPKAVTYTADWETAEQFHETLWSEALARGASTARAVAVIGDGAPWIWETANTLFPRAVEILDWYHLSEHLWHAAAVVHGEGNEQTTALAKMWETEVWEGRSALVESHLRELVPMHDDRDHTLRRCADYLQTHQTRLRYDLFRAAGWPIGSGVVEGGCKHVVGLRFKRQSTRWTKRGAQAVLYLRLDRINKRWDQRCELVRRAA